MRMPYITNIQKYSIHDGEGIRTTVFFKGCRLACRWCHNPENQSFRSELMYRSEKCVGCRACEAACPKKAIRFDPYTHHVLLDRRQCDLCGACVDSCAFGAREITGKQYPVDELVRELEKDRMFFELSGGGVTLSGGEIMEQDMDYVGELLKKLSEGGCSVALDTCGYAPYESFRRILPYADTFLYDIKLIDPEKHRKFIGMGNELILDNLKRLSADGARIHIRIPVIGGVNDDEESMRAIIDFLKQNVNVQAVSLLPYHTYGSEKYGRLGRTYPGEGLTVPDGQKMEKFAALFQKNGFSPVKIGG